MHPGNIEEVKSMNLTSSRTWKPDNLRIATDFQVK